MKAIHLIYLLPSLILMGCDNPGTISDSEYDKYKELGAPKILYSCTHYVSKLYVVLEKCLINPSDSDCDNLEDEVVKDSVVGYVAGVGPAPTYNSLMLDAKKECTDQHGKFEVLEGEQ